MVKKNRRERIQKKKKKLGCIAILLTFLMFGIRSFGSSRFSPHENPSYLAKFRCCSYETLTDWLWMVLGRMSMILYAVVSDSLILVFIYRIRFYRSWSKIVEEEKKTRDTLEFGSLFLRCRLQMHVEVAWY